MPGVGPQTPRRGFPLSVVVLLAAAGLAAAGALVFLGLWLQTIGTRQGWWDLPTDDEAGVALGLGGLLVGLTGILTWAAARRCRRTFGYSPLATSLIVLAVLIGVIVLVLGASV